MYELGASEWGVGIISTGLYLGVIAGSLKALIIIKALGNKKSYLLFSGSMALCVLGFGIYTNNFIWFCCRVVCGMGIAGIWIVIESLIIDKSFNTNRGKYFSLYMIATYASSAIGQLFLAVPSKNYLVNFAIISMVFMLSGFMLFFVNDSQNKHFLTDNYKKYKISSFRSPGIIGCLYSGMTLAILYTILPYYFEVVGFTANKICKMMFLLLAGGAVFQIPTGILSDKYRRYHLLIMLGFLSIFFTILLMVSAHNSYYYIIIFLMGGAYFSIYPVSMSHVCEGLPDNQATSVAQKMVLVYGIGNVMGPIIAPGFITIFGPEGLFVCLITLGIFFLNLAKNKINET